MKKTSTHPRTSFSNPNLQDALQESTPIFDSHKNYLDQLSKEIKDLEDFIRDKGINIEYTMYLEEAPGDETGLFGSYLKWKRDKNSNKFRLMYAFHKDGELPDHDEPSGRPLLEMPVDIRIHGYQFLPQFVKELGNHIKSIHGNFPQSLNLTQVASKELEEIQPPSHSPPDKNSLKVLKASSA